MWAGLCYLLLTNKVKPVVCDVGVQIIEPVASCMSSFTLSLEASFPGRGGVMVAVVGSSHGMRILRQPVENSTE